MKYLHLSPNLHLITKLLIAFLFFMLLFPSCNNEELYVVEESTFIEEEEEPDVEEEPDNGTATPVVPVDVVDDAYSTFEDVPVVIEAYLNDENLPSAFTVSNTNPSNGVLTINDNGTPDNLLDDSILYAPNAGFFGTDSFEYTVCDVDNVDNCDTAIVTIVVEEVIDNDIATELKAFPTAEGFGKFSTGGRGGTVIKVTNLNNSGAGSFRAACEASGARIVVFEVGGRINLSSTIRITNPNITIAGQTSPGGGIMLSVEGHPNTPVLEISASNVIMRYISIRNTSTVVSSSNSDGLRVSGGSDIIVDHCSFSWASDENLGIYNYSGGKTQNVTIQNCIIANGYNGSSKGAINAGGYDRISYYQNAFISNNQRNPLFNNDSSSTNPDDAYVEVVNNVLYDYKFAIQFSLNWSSGGVPHGNFVKNKGMQPSGGSTVRRFVYMATQRPVGVYVEGNIDGLRPTDDLDNWESTQGAGGAADLDQLGNTSYRSTAPFSTQIINDNIALYDANDIWSNIKNHVGNSYPQRDSFDALLINDVDNGTVSSSNSSAVGGFPTLANGTPPTDIDNDGMPDSWETAVFDTLSKEGNGDTDGDGYTDLEEYLNTLDN